MDFKSVIHYAGTIETDLYAVLDVVDPDDPTTWTFQLMTSWPSDKSNSTAITLDDIRSKMALFAHPFSSANEWVTEESGFRIGVNNLSSWLPVPFDNRRGRITLAGDAAHPMTFHRGQGLNHAIADVDNLLKAILAVVGRDTIEVKSEAIFKYDHEVRQRGGNEVKVSKINSIMLHDWNSLMDSPLMKVGADKG